MKIYGLQVEGSPLGQPTASRYAFLWAKHVRGFREDKHCAACLVGEWEKKISRSLVDGVYEIPQKAPFFYICGVTGNFDWANNLHFVLKPKEGGIAMIDAEYGMRLTIYNAERVMITPLPLHWKGLNRTFTTCRNFQFGVEQFGYGQRPAGHLPFPDSGNTKDGEIEKSIVAGFIAKGVALGEIALRENIFTYWVWQLRGRKVRKGEHGVKATIAGPAPRILTFFHVSQTDPITA
jgi:hypothetical protein